MREIKISVKVVQDGQAKKYGDSVYRFLIEVDGEFSEKRVFRFCRECLNGGGVAYEEWSKDNATLETQNKETNFSTYFTGYYKFSQSIIEQDKNGIVTKAVYDYSVTIPYCD